MAAGCRGHGGWSRPAGDHRVTRASAGVRHISSVLTVGGGRGSDAAPPSGAAVRIRVVEVRDGLGLGGVEGRGLIELEVGLAVKAEVGLRRTPSRGEGWRCGGQTEVAEDGLNGLELGEEGEDALVGAAVGALEGEDLVDAGEETGSAGARGEVPGCLRRARR